MEASWVKIDHYMSQYLSGHGNFRSKLRKFSLVTTDKCRCEKVDTPYHTFFECELLENQRQEYKSRIRNLGLGWPPSPKQSITEEVIKDTTVFVAKVLISKETWEQGTTI